jgi:hypothetical protein
MKKQGYEFAWKKFFYLQANNCPLLNLSNNYDIIHNLTFDEVFGCFQRELKQGHRFGIRDDEDFF